MDKVITLYGRVFVECQIKAETGLHIGGSEAGMSIGGVDNVVIRDPISQRPYIPGSSLKGKMRSLMEKATGALQNNPISEKVKIHCCETVDSYDECVVCHIYGLPGQREFSSPTRLIVRDAFLDPDSVVELQAARTDLPFSEVKWEASIDRVTSAAVPRQVERVPAGAVFGPASMVYSIYEDQDIGRFRDLIRGMQLLEDDYLGGLGSRGSGEVVFQGLSLGVKDKDNYSAQARPFGDESFPDLASLAGSLNKVIDWLESEIPIARG